MGKKLFLFAAAAVALASCTETDLSGDTSFAKESTSDAIQFSATARGTGTTRAGFENTTGMTTPLLKNDGGTSGGFGVFAYYTGKDTYGQHQQSTYTGETTGSSVTAKYPNFMYNQQVTWDATHWTYAPLKYWPNDFANGTAVDGQTTDGAATGSSTYGGNVSFFAYAPYVEVTQATANGQEGANPASGAIGYSNTDGIVHLSGNEYAGDPYITYTMPNDINAGGNWVDLLWGTLSGTTQNVLGTAQNGVTGKSSAANDTYIKAILDGETVNADLNKQKVDGTVGFAFKHALAKIGGHGDGIKTGFLVQLDIDNSEAGEASTAIKGGSREKFATSGSGSDDAWRTIVTIKDIEITNDLNGTDAGLGDDAVGLGGTNKLNLATGQWGTATGTTEFTQTIGVPAPASYNALLNSKIAEQKDGSTTWFTNLISTNVSDYFAFTNTEDTGKPHPGVTETAQSVYNEESQSPIILFPGTTPKFKVTVDYIVRTYDANLSTKYSEVEQIISKVITFQNAVELNKHYTLLMHLGLTSVKFTATVSDWDADTDDDNDVDIDDAEDIYLPINVISSTEAVVPAGTSPTVYTAAGTTSYTINLTGLTNGNKVAVTGTVNAASAAFTAGTADSEGKATLNITGMTANTSTADAASSVITIKEFNDADDDDVQDAEEPTVSTTTVTIVQNKNVD